MDKELGPLAGEAIHGLIQIIDIPTDEMNTLSNAPF